MIPARWQQISYQLHEAMLLDRERRPVFLKQVVRSDPEMPREIETLLKAYDDADSSFLKTPEADRSSAPTSASQADIIGQRFGDYRVNELIGKGGMGEVYRAPAPAHCCTRWNFPTMWPPLGKHPSSAAEHGVQVEDRRCARNIAAIDSYPRLARLNFR